jgi:hypothetical protein
VGAISDHDLNTQPAPLFQPLLFLPPSHTNSLLAGL